MKYISLLIILLTLSQNRLVGADSKEWASFVDEFLESYFQHHPCFAVQQGRHDFDGRLPDWSDEGLRKTIQHLHGSRKRAQAFRNLSGHQAFERKYLLARIQRDLFWLETLDWPHKSPTFYFDWELDNLDPDVYLTPPYAPIEVRLSGFIKYLKALPKAAEQIQLNLRRPLPPSYRETGLQRFKGLASYLSKEAPAVFKTVTDGALQTELREAVPPAVQSLLQLVAALEAQPPGTEGSFAIGKKFFREMLQQTEMLDIPLAKVEKMGRADFERNLAALEKACQKLAPGKSVQEALAQVSASKPPEGPVAGARRQLSVLKNFLKAENIVTIPSTADARVEESPPHARWNFAYINLPGPFSPEAPAIYYIAPPDPTWSKEDQENYIPGETDLLFTSVHEVWPGHFLHALHSYGAKSKIGRVFHSYAFSEGWAHYAEEMMFQEGLGDFAPEYQIGQLLNALLRNARLLSAIGLHSRTMSVAESEELFIKAHQARATARQQAARGTFDPAYLNYTLGKLLILEMRDEWRAKNPRETLQRFHDQLLSYGGPPLPLVREQILPKGHSLN